MRRPCPGWRPLFGNTGTQRPGAQLVFQQSHRGRGTQINRTRGEPSDELAALYDRRNVYGALVGLSGTREAVLLRPLQNTAPRRGGEGRVRGTDRRGGGRAGCRVMT